MVLLDHQISGHSEVFKLSADPRLRIDLLLDDMASGRQPWVHMGRGKGRPTQGAESNFAGGAGHMDLLDEEHLIALDAHLVLAGQFF